MWISGPQNSLNSRHNCLEVTIYTLYQGPKVTKAGRKLEYAELIYKEINEYIKNINLLYYGP